MLETSSEWNHKVWSWAWLVSLCVLSSNSSLLLWGTFFHNSEKGRRLQRPRCSFSNDSNNRCCVLTLSEQQAGVAWGTLTAQLVILVRFSLLGVWMWNMVSFCSLGLLETQCIAQDILEFTAQPRMASHFWWSSWLTLWSAGLISIEHAWRYLLSFKG